MSGRAHLPLSADQPLALEQLAGAWVVESGFVDLFAVRRAADGHAGRREFLLRLGPGASLCAAAARAGEPPLALLAVGGMDTMLAGAADPAAATEAWVAAADEMMRDPARGWAERLASPGEASLEEGALLGIAGRGVLWASVLEGELAGPDGEAADPGAPIPLTAACPLLARAASRVLLRPTTALSPRELEAALHGHRLALLHYAGRVLQRREAERAERLDRSATASAEALAAGLATLAGQASADGHAEPGTDPAWGALRLVARAIGQALPEQPAGVGPLRPAAERIETYAGLAELRLRAVLLKPGWWRRDNGPLLAVRERDGAPLALLPRRGGYRLWDPATGRSRGLSGAEAETLAPTAWMPYRGFPAAAVPLRGLLRFAAHGLGQEGVRLAWLSLAAALLGLAGPIGIGLLVEKIIPASAHDTLLLLGAGLLAAAVGAAGLELTRGLVLQRIEARFALDTQAALFDRLLRLPVGFFRRFGAGDLADRVLAVEQVRRSLTGASIGAALAGVLALANAGVMLVCNLHLGLVGLGAALLTAAVSLWLCARQVRRERSLAERRGRAENFVLEAIAGVGKLKVAAALDRAFAVWARLYGRQRAAFAQAQRLRDAQAIFIAGFLPVATAVLFLLAASLSEELRVQAVQAAARALASAEPLAPPAGFGLGAWLAFAAAFGQLMAGVAQAVQAVSGALAVVPLYARARPILETPPESGRGAQPPGLLSGAVEFSRVSFGYTADAPPVLQELSFAIQPGEYVAIVGPSGSGKSTILRLLLGFEAPSAGAVLYDGRPLTSLDAAAVRRQVGVVLQHGRLQQGSILENIGAGHPIGLEDAWSAARLAGLGEDIRAMPMGMHTILTESGGTLSGGQRQRLMIARALARKPRVLLLDEATSALDNSTQSVVTAAVAGLGLTRIVVAHRLSTIALVDRVLVLNRGRLVQSGRFEELMAQPGLFQDLARRQLA